MSENINEDFRTQTISPEPDDLLKALVAIVGESTRGGAEQGTEFTITLSVAGATIAGLLVGRDVWIKRMLAEYGDRNPLAIAIEQKWAEENDEADEDGMEYKYLHLVDAKIYTGGEGIPSKGGIYWRGRIASIDGWSFGSFTPGPA